MSLFFSRSVVAAVATAALVATPLASAQSVDPASSALGSIDFSATGSSDAAADSFYDQPARVPQQPGMLISREDMRVGFALPTAPWPSQATRIMYSSQNTHNEPIAITGSVYTPRVAWNGDGPRPLAIIAPGTLGGSAHCGATRSITRFVQLENRENQGMSLNLGYEMFPLLGLLSRGFTVAITDYEGMANFGVHTYMNRKAQAHAIVDVARAAIALESTDLTEQSPIVAYGYSQGGGAAAAAAELAHTYGPELNMVGMVAAAPPADLREVSQGIDRSAIVGAVGYAMNGLAYAYPEFAAEVDKQLNAKGKKMLADARSECIPDSILSYGLTETKTLTNSGASAREMLNQNPVFNKYIAMQVIGEVKPSMPVLVTGNTHDDAVPGAQARSLAANWCALGATVLYSEDPLPPIFPKSTINHMAPMLTNLPRNIQYMVDRARGLPAPSNCAR